MRDFRGVELRVGDKVAYVDGTPSGHQFLVEREVLELGQMHNGQMNLIDYAVLSLNAGANKPARIVASRRIVVLGR